MLREPIATWIGRHARHLPPAQSRAHASRVEGWTSVVLNTALFAVKLAIGLSTGSVSLIADAVHTASDSASSAVVIIAARMARRPADERHPFGYGRVESIGAIMIAVLLGVAALEFGRASVEHLLHPSPLDATWPGIAIIGGTVLVKLWMSLFARTLGEDADSTILKVDAWHHATDVLATIPVIVAMIASRQGYPGVDGWMGLVVAAVIGWAAFELAREATRPLIGEAPSPEEISEIETRALAVSGVRGVHDIVVHRYGDVRIVSLHIEVDQGRDALALHALAEHVEDKVGDGSHGQVVVHVDPIDLSHPAYERTRRVLQDFVQGEPALDSFHDLRLFGGTPRLEVSVDIALSRAMAPAAQDELRDRLLAHLQAQQPGCRLRVEFEPVFAYRNS